MTSRPHDALFKAAFEAPEHARGLFCSILPPSVSASIDWAMLRRESGSYIEPELRDRHSDLLFSARLADTRVLLYLLLEHQSSSDDLMLVRMLGYIARVLQRHHKDHGMPLPLIVPLVVSNAPGGWTSPRSFSDLFEVHPRTIPGLAELVPSFVLIVDDLMHVDETQLRARALAAFPQLALWLLRDGRDTQRVIDDLEAWADAFHAVLAAPHGLEAVAQLFRYVALVTGDLQFEQFRAKLRKALPDAEEVAMTIAEQLREEGRAKGREEGSRAGRAAVLDKLLTLKFGPLPSEAKAHIEQATIEELESYIERILVADTLAAVLGTLP